MFDPPTITFTFEEWSYMGLGIWFTWCAIGGWAANEDRKSGNTLQAHVDKIMRGE
jgi:hypothetical protein